MKAHTIAIWVRSWSADAGANVRAGRTAFRRCISRSWQSEVFCVETQFYDGKVMVTVRIVYRGRENGRGGAGAPCASSCKAQVSIPLKPPSFRIPSHLLRNHLTTSIRACSIWTRTCDVCESIVMFGSVACGRNKTEDTRVYKPTSIKQ